MLLISDFCLIVVPIPGSRTRARVQENAAAALIKLSDEDVREIRRIVDAFPVGGNRYPDETSGDVGVDSIPLADWKGE